MYTPENVADKLKVSTKTVYGLIKRGELPASKVGALLRISEEQLQRYLSKENGVKK